MNVFREKIRELKRRQKAIIIAIESKPTYDEMCRLCDEQAKISNEITLLKRYLMFE